MTNTARRIVEKHIGRSLYNPVNLYLEGGRKPLTYRMNKDEARAKMYELRKILSEFWQDGWISSYTSEKVIEQLPPRLKEL